MKQYCNYLGQQKLAVLLRIWNSHFSLPSTSSFLHPRPNSYRFLGHLYLLRHLLFTRKKYMGSSVLETWWGVSADRYRLCPVFACWSLFLSERVTPKHSGLRFRKSRGVAYGILKSGFEQEDSRVSFSFRNTRHFLCSLYFGTKLFSMEKWCIR